MKVNSNMTSFFHFVNKRAIYLDGKISLAHLNQVIKSQNKIIYNDVSDLNIFFLLKSYWVTIEHRILYKNKYNIFS